MVARFLLPALLLPVLMAAAPFSAPAQAAASLSFGPDLHQMGLGQTGGFTFEGLQGVAGSEDLAAILSLTLVGTSASSYTFDYAITNAAGGVIDTARIAGFGFDLSADYKSASATGLFDKTAKGNIPGFGKTDLCVVAGSNGNSCAGNAKGGVAMGDSAAKGTLTIAFEDLPAAVRLENAFVRWQSVDSAKLELKSASGTPAVTMLQLPPYPEPSTWAMMITGFGLVGAAARRRQGAQVVSA